jgi:hypothetical protein
MQPGLCGLGPPLLDEVPGYGSQQAYCQYPFYDHHSEFKLLLQIKHSCADDYDDNDGESDGTIDPDCPIITKFCSTTALPEFYIADDHVDRECERIYEIENREHASEK